MTKPSRLFYQSRSRRPVLDRAEGIYMMTHCDKQGRSKIVRECRLPITASACVARIYTDLAVVDVGAQGLILREIAQGISLDEVVAATEAPLQVPDNELPTF